MTEREPLRENSRECRLARLPVPALAAALIAALAPASVLADTSRAPSVTAGLTGWDGTFRVTEINARRAHYILAEASVSAACPKESTGVQIELDLDPAAGLFTPSPEDGSEVNLSEPLVFEGSDADWQASLALRPGAIYRLRAGVTCCERLSSDKKSCEGNAGSSQKAEVISDELSVPPKIDTVRALKDGYFYGKLLANETIPFIAYDGTPEPGWPREAANMRKFIKLTGAGVNFKTKDFNSSTNSMSVSAIQPTSEGKISAVLTLKGRLFTPEGKEIRTWTLTSEPFSIPVSKDACILDSTYSTFILEGEEPRCLDKSVFEDEPEDTEESGGCSTSSAGQFSLSTIVLPCLGLICLARRRSRSQAARMSQN